MKRSFRHGLLAALGLAQAGACLAQNYLPLEAGSRWQLRSRSSAKPIILEVLRSNASSSLLRFDNPWIGSDLELVPNSGRYYVSNLTMNGQTAKMPAETLYWDTTAREHQKWSSAIGNMEVVSRRKTVQAMGRTFQNCLQIQETNKQGNRLYWTFAPDFGFVQFGEGKDAFVLENFRAGHGESRGPVSELPNRNGIEARPVLQDEGGSRRSSGAVRIALAANPFANESFSPKAVEARFRQARDAGVNLIYLSPKWNEIETGRGKYKLDDIRYQISEAVHENIPAILHIRIIDTNQRSLPGDLGSKAWDSGEMLNRVDSLFDAVFPVLQGKAVYFLVGNEIEGYFKQHRDEVDAYARLVAHVSSRIKARIPGAQISVSTGFDGVDQMASTLRPIADKTDFFASTYYAMSPDFYVRDPSGVDSDIGHIVRAAGGKKVFLQEVGYPTSANNHSSEEKQAETFTRVLDAVAANAGRFIGVNFTFMSDFSDSMVKGFSAYYKMPGADRFSSFLKTLGMFDDKGRPKKSWAAFQQKVQAVSR